MGCYLYYGMNKVLVSLKPNKPQNKKERKSLADYKIVILVVS